ncbi:hypothetical protein COZ13_09625 [Candidatus Desantisbacteria bacterium CG_4_10_14_3_um_filter_40_18]|uniref:Uncharacterized protein n=1 Tax=Candidatus Desantisbacteria bacterium CG_4_10_14_3_um_filter_40_18 TaxID=1974544 RepID=A0A2M7NZ51_9BACT|nr:MAG: hypothetical protein COZ13_09625 [Candidatus Desantisbacteria bacterium CG_4_10_14_3_um_filter_40_18]
MSALTGRDLITNDRMSAADMGLGLLGGIGSLANTASGASKVINLGKSLGNLGSSLCDLRTASIAIRGRKQSQSQISKSNGSVNSREAKIADWTNV